MWLDKYLFKAEWLVVLLVLAFVAILALPDKSGVNVSTIEIEGYVCYKVVPFASDQKVAICKTMEECSKICSELNSK